MTEGVYQAILLLLGAIIAALLFVVFKNSGKLADGVPQPVVLMVLNMLLSLLEGWALKAAKGTPTTLDDEGIQQAILLIKSLLATYDKPAEPVPEAPSVPQPQFVQVPFVQPYPSTPQPPYTVTMSTTDSPSTPG
jgi:hypothetical protein